MKLYFECYSGISGDMIVGALLSLGADESKLRDVIDGLHLNGYRIEISQITKSAIQATDFNVILDNDNHDHDMQYLYGHNHGEIEHHHECEHHHDEHAHHHSHRGVREIVKIIDSDDKLSENAKNIAKKIFHILAVAEASVHGTTIEQVHFHEVGAVDSIIDIVSIAFCLDNLGVNEVIVPKLYEGQGTVRCQHGILPVPVPAVSNIVASYHIPITIQNVQGELVTPTGAATVAAIKTSESLPDTFNINKIGVGAGKREYVNSSGLLRIMNIE